MKRLLVAALFLIAFKAHAEEAKVSASDKDKAEVAAIATAPEMATAPMATSAIENKKESEIPLNLDAPKKATEESHPLFKALLIISLVGLVGTGAFVFLRKHAKSNYALGKNNQIKVITQHYLGPKKSLAIVRVAGESILIGITDHNVSMIKSLSLLDDEVPEATPSSFSDVFHRESGGMIASETASNPSDEDEEFSIRGIKDVVSKRLKGMRSLQ